MNEPGVPIDETGRLRREIDALRRALEKSEAENECLRRDKQNLEKAKEGLEKEKKDLEGQLARLHSTPGVLALSDRTAEAASVPSSKVFYRRPTEGGNGKKSGGQVGHVGHARARPEPNQPTRRITLDCCPSCHAKLGAPADFLQRTITDLPPPILDVYEEHRARYWCGGCGLRVTADSLLAPYEQWGPRLVAFVAHHRMLALSLQKVQGLLQESYRLDVSEAAILGMEAHVAKLLGPRYNEILAKVRAAAVVHGDETKFRVGGQNAWMWTFATLEEVLYEVAPTRGHSVPVRILAGFDGVLVRDAWDPYDFVTNADHQLDLLHVNRWLERAEVKAGIEPRPLVAPREAKMTRPGRPPENLLRFVDAVRGILREAITIVATNPGLSKKQRNSAHNALRRRLLAKLNDAGPHPDARRIAKELRSRIDQVFTFVRTADVPWHNNEAERAIRQGVLHRKIAGGRQTWAGAARLHTLMSVFETCKKTGESFVAVAQEVLAQESWAPSRIASGAP